MWLLLVVPLALAAADSSTSSARVVTTSPTPSTVASTSATVPTTPSRRATTASTSLPRARSSSLLYQSPPPLRPVPLPRTPPPPPLVAAMMLPPLDKDRPPPVYRSNFNINRQLINDIKNELKRDNDDYREKLERRSLPRVTRRWAGGAPRGGAGAPALAALIPTLDPSEQLVQPVQAPRRRPTPPPPPPTTTPRRPMLPVGRALMWPRPDRLRPLRAMPRPPPRPPAPYRPLATRPSPQQLTPRREFAGAQYPMMKDAAWTSPDMRAVVPANQFSLLKQRKQEKMKKLVKFIKANKNLLRQLVEVKRERELRTPLRKVPSPRRPAVRAEQELRPDLLDLAQARGFKVAGMRIKGRICQRHILNLEGPKYNAKGNVYRPEFVQKNGRLFEKTKPPDLILPVCCNCCKKSVLGCE